MSVSPAPLLPARFYDSNNIPLSGGKLFTYAAGTTTKQATYTDNTGNTQNTNPVSLNSRGEAAVYCNPNLNYKFVLAPAFDTDPPSAPIWTYDNISVADLTLRTDLAAVGGQALVGSLPNNTPLKARNAAGNADNNILVYNASNKLSIGVDASSLGLMTGQGVYASTQALSDNFNVYALSESTRSARFHLTPVTSSAHSGVQHSLVGLEGRVAGSTVNGPSSADIGFTLSMIKSGWPNAGAVIGEMDGFNSVIRQCGTTSDSAAYLADVAASNHTGFLAGYEGVTQRLDNITQVATQSVRTQLSVLDNVAGNSIAVYGLADTGIVNSGLFLRSTDGSNKFTNYVTCVLGGATLFNVAGDGTVASAAAITSSSPSGGMGYATGAGGAVTQITSRTTGVTLNKVCGQIVLFSAAGSATWATFTVTNSSVAATDVIRLNQASGTDKYMLHVTHVTAGSFDISFATTGGTTTEQPAFNFAVAKAVAA